MTRLLLLWMLIGGLIGCVAPPKPPDCDGPFAPINTVGATGDNDARFDD
jgi:hypothetical protein